MAVELPKQAWYAIDLASALKVGAKPSKYRLFGVPLLVWRTSHGVIAALTDRCPHRGVPLSMGRRVGDDVQCGYHGWRFDPAGTCVAIPGLEGDPSRDPRRASRWVAKERQGVVWVWADLASEPTCEPPTFAHAEDSAYTVVKRTFVMPGPVYDAIENALDVPHTAFVHAGLFRIDGPRRPVHCVIERGESDATCTFEGEKPPTGLAAKILGARDGKLVHIDRFRLPTLTEVTYRLGDKIHVVLAGAWTPIDETHTQLVSVVCVKSPLPNALLRIVLEPIGVRIVKQDMKWLAAQVAYDSVSPGTRASTPIDVLAGPIRRLLADAVAGKRTPPASHSTTMWV